MKNKRWPEGKTKAEKEWIRQIIKMALTIKKNRNLRKSYERSGKNV